MRQSQTSTAKAERRWVEASVLTVIVRMAEIVADAVDDPVVAGGIADAVGAVDVAVAADATVADAAGLAGDGTKALATDLHGFTRKMTKKATTCVVAFLVCLDIVGQALAQEKKVPHRA